LLRELEEIKALRRLLRTDPDDVVRRTTGGASQGVLGQEREFLAIAALIALDRRDAAAERAETFRRAHAGSALVSRLDELMALPGER